MGAALLGWWSNTQVVLEKKAAGRHVVRCWKQRRKCRCFNRFVEHTEQMLAMKSLLKRSVARMSIGVVVRCFQVTPAAARGLVAVP